MYSRKPIPDKKVFKENGYVGIQKRECARRLWFSLALSGAENSIQTIYRPFNLISHGTTSIEKIRVSEVFEMGGRKGENPLPTNAM
jgi:hypothetical protein